MADALDERRPRCGQAGARVVGERAHGGCDLRQLDLGRRWERGHPDGLTVAAPASDAEAAQRVGLQAAHPAHEGPSGSEGAAVAVRLTDGLDDAGYARRFGQRRDEPVALALPHTGGPGLAAPPPQRAGRGLDVCGQA